MHSFTADMDPRWLNDVFDKFRYKCKISGMSPQGFTVAADAPLVTENEKSKIVSVIY